MAEYAQAFILTPGTLAALRERVRRNEAAGYRRLTVSLVQLKALIDAAAKGRPNA